MTEAGEVQDGQRGAKREAEEAESVGLAEGVLEAAVFRSSWTIKVAIETDTLNLQITSASLCIIAHVLCPVRANGTN